MAKTIALVGKQGPLFGNRPSHTEMTFVTFADTDYWTRVSNWPADDRTDALRAMFDGAAETIERDGDFAGMVAGL